MRIHSYPGFFIDIEGLDGSGSSTQVRLVAQALKKEKVKAYTTKEPSKGPIGRLVRKALKGEFNSLSSASLQLLFAADRGQHLAKEVIPRLKKGELVITDRYAWSSVAFGSVDLAKNWLLELNKDFILPDLTVLIEVSPDICLERLKREKQGLELFEEEETLDRAWGNYHSLVNKYWWTHMLIADGEQKRKEVTEEILTYIKRHSKFRRYGRIRRR